VARIEARCSFCGRTRNQVDRLVAGPGVFICDQCVSLCSEIINQPSGAGVGQATGQTVGVDAPRRPWWRRIFRVDVGAPA
jgi:hypothetical protein